MRIADYEGDTLVIDTVGVKVGPFASVDQYGSPHTEALHVIERYRLLDYEAMIAAEARGERETFHLDTTDAGFSRDLAYTGKGLQLEFMVEDEGVFTTPWSATGPIAGHLGQWRSPRRCEHAPLGAMNDGHESDCWRAAPVRAPPISRRSPPAM
jgi:hypothetical protein